MPFSNINKPTGGKFLNVKKINLSSNKERKILSLFDDRQIKVFIRHHDFNDLDESNTILQLKKLQAIVYSLDEYGEKNWGLSTAKIEKMWRKIEDYVGHIGFDDDTTYRLLEKMFQYMQIEIKIREGVLPTKIMIDDYYDLKICDVELQRNIIRKRALKERGPEYYSVWKIYDLLSEILDDIDDLNEDTKDFNCNRLIFTTELKGENCTKKEYLDYINRLKISFFECICSISDINMKSELENLFILKINDIIEKLTESNIQLFKSRALKELQKNSLENNGIQGNFDLICL